MMLLVFFRKLSKNENSMLNKKKIGSLIDTTFVQCHFVLQLNFEVTDGWSQSVKNINTYYATSKVVSFPAMLRNHKWSWNCLQPCTKPKTNHSDKMPTDSGCITANLWWPQTHDYQDINYKILIKNKPLSETHDWFLVFASCCFFFCFTTFLCALTMSASLTGRLYAWEK